MNMKNFDPRALLRDDAVHKSVYTDPEIFELEMKRIFGRAWLYLAHDSEIKQAGRLRGPPYGDPGGYPDAREEWRCRDDL